MLRTTPPQLSACWHPGISSLHLLKQSCLRGRFSHALYRLPHRRRHDKLSLLFPPFPLPPPTTNSVVAVTTITLVPHLACSSLLSSTPTPRCRPCLTPCHCHHSFPITTALHRLHHPCCQSFPCSSSFSPTASSSIPPLSVSPLLLVAVTTLPCLFLLPTTNSVAPRHQLCPYSLLLSSLPFHVPCCHRLLRTHSLPLIAIAANSRCPRLLVIVGLTSHGKLMKICTPCRRYW